MDENQLIARAASSTEKASLLTRSKPNLNRSISYMESLNLSQGRLLMNNYQRYLKSDHWKILRGAKLQINPRCEVCGSRDELEVHHAVYRSTWFESKISDLKTLCHDHHICEHVCGARESMDRMSKEIQDDKKFSDWKYRDNPFIKYPNYITLEKRNEIRIKNGKSPIM